MTGQIVAIGARIYADSGIDQEFFKHQVDTGEVRGQSREFGLLHEFGSWAGEIEERAGTRISSIISWSGSNQKSNFDADFILRRVMALQVNRWIFQGPHWVDAAQEVFRYASYPTFQSLDKTCREMGITKAYEGLCTGATFADYYRTHPEDAMRYLRGDVADLHEIWFRLQWINPSLATR